MWLDVDANVFFVINVLNTYGNIHMSGRSCMDILREVSRRLDNYILSRYLSLSHLSDADLHSFSQTLH